MDINRKVIGQPILVLGEKKELTFR